MKTGKFILCAMMILTARLADAQSIGVGDFSGGLNVNPNVQRVGANEGQVCSDAVLDDPMGSFRVRPGVRAAWTDILSFEGSDNRHSYILSLFGQRFDDGKPYLFRVEKRRDSATADIYVSAPYGYAPSKRLAGRIYPERGSWISWNGIQYYFDRHNDPYMLTRKVDSFKVDDLVLPAPGQLKATAYATSGNLDGTYIWGLVTHWRCDTAGTYHWSKRYSTLSRPITLSGERAILSKFTQILGDSCAAAPSSDTFMIVRNRANRLDYGLDSLFRVGIVVVAHSSVPQYQWIDNVSDAVLADSNFYRTIRDTSDYGDLRNSPLARFGTIRPWYAAYWWGNLYGTHSTEGFGINQAYAVGQPTIRRHDSSTYSYDSVSGSFGAQDLTGFQVYHIALLDTTTGRMSDTGTGLFIGGVQFDTTAGLDKVRHFRNRNITLPATPSASIFRVLIRRDYLYQACNNYTSMGSFSVGTDTINCQFRNPGIPLSVTPGYYRDTIRDSAVTDFFDRLRPHSIDSISRLYERMVPPLTILKGGVVHEGRLYVYDDKLLYCSASDSASSFAFFNEVELGLDDGEKILGIVSKDGYLIVQKTGSIWTLYTDQEGLPVARSKRSSGYGMAASNSLASVLGNPVYLSELGVANLSENPYRANSPVPGYLSQNVWPLMRRSAANMLNAHAVGWQNRYLLSFPGTDSTFVYFGLTGGWSVWGFDFGAACLYDTTHGNASPRTLVFASDTTNLVTGFSGRSLFLLDDSASKDNGIAFSATWAKYAITRAIESEIMPEYVTVRSDSYPWSDSAVTGQVTGAVVGEEHDTLKTFTVPGLYVNTLAGIHAGKRYKRMPLKSPYGSTAIGLSFTLSSARRGLIVNEISVDLLNSGLTPAGGK